MKVTMPLSEWTFLVELVQRIKTESAAMGYVDIEGDRLLVHDLFVPEQVVTGATFEIDQTSLGKMAEENRTERNLDPSRIRFQWHSHGAMSTGPSSVDHNNVIDLLKCSGTWLLTMIMNRSLDYTLQLDTVTPAASVRGLALYVPDARLDRALAAVQDRPKVLAAWPGNKRGPTVLPDEYEWQTMF